MNIFGVESHLLSHLASLRMDYHAAAAQTVYDKNPSDENSLIRKYIGEWSLHLYNLVLMFNRHHNNWWMKYLDPEEYPFLITGQTNFIPLICFL